jgi:hypothetical protein
VRLRVALLSGCLATPGAAAARHDADALDVLEAVVKHRLERGRLYSFGVPGDKFGEPVTTACLSVASADPPPALLERFDPPYEVHAISKCPPALFDLRLACGAIEWNGKDRGEVLCRGLGTDAPYRAVRQKGKWVLSVSLVS